jgi:cleavage and polyadenylation specificity factor subunit 2
VGYVHGRISVTADSSIPLLEPIALGEREPPSDTHPIYPTTSRAPQNGNSALPYRTASSLPQSTIIGDLKLAMLKSRLGTLGISAEFAGEGVLVCGGGTNGGGNGVSTQYVAVKKTGRGQVILEGAPSDVYYTVRQQVYGLHAVVADM